MFAAADNAVTLPTSRASTPASSTREPALRAQVNVENLFDENYYPNANSNNNITPGSPLAVRAGVTVNF